MKKRRKNILSCAISRAHGKRLSLPCARSRVHEKRLSLPCARSQAHGKGWPMTWRTGHFSSPHTRTPHPCTHATSPVDATPAMPAPAVHGCAHHRRAGCTRRRTHLVAALTQPRPLPRPAATCGVRPRHRCHPWRPRPPAQARSRAAGPPRPPAMLATTPGRCAGPHRGARQGRPSAPPAPPPPQRPPVQGRGRAAYPPQSCHPTGVTRADSTTPPHLHHCKYPYLSC